MAFTTIAKDLNEKIVIKVMRDMNPHSKQEIAVKTGLSFPTVSKLIDEMIIEKKVILLGVDEESKGGRKANIFCLNNDYTHILALFIQERKIWGSSFNVAGKRLKTSHMNLGNEESIIEGLKALITKCRKEDSLITVIEIGVPGSVRNGKICYIDGYEELKGVDLEQTLKETCGCKIHVSNNMRAVAEYAACSQMEEADLACIHLAETGPGCGAIVNGRAINGFYGFNGEVGFIPFYGEKTLQQVAMEGFRETTPGEYLGKIIISLCTILNPKQIVLYLENEWEINQVREELHSYILRFLPEEVVPELIFSDRYQEDYLRGLLYMGIEGVYS